MSAMPSTARARAVSTLFGHPQRPRHHFQDQHMSGNARVHEVDAINFSEFHWRAQQGGRDPDYATQSWRTLLHQLPRAYQAPLRLLREAVRPFLPSQSLESAFSRKDIRAWADGQ